MRSDKCKEPETVPGLRVGDRIVFDRLFKRHTPSMIRVAHRTVSSRAVAEEIAWETWLAVLKSTLLEPPTVATVVGYETCIHEKDFRP